MKKNSPPFTKINFRELSITAPSLLWLTILFAIPTLMIFVIAFKASDAYGNISPEWTLVNVHALINRYYPAVVWRTVWLSCMTTILCIGLAIPVAYFMARISRKWRNLFMLLIIIPFWTNFLIRIFSWKTLLHPEGPLKHVLVLLHLVPVDVQLMYNPWAVLTVLVYTYLPFAILPVYAAAEKFDFGLIEAARDLGARQLTALYRIFIPGIKMGIWSAAAMVFVPSLGSYVIPDLVGGTASDMIGNKIAQRALISRNLPEASMLSATLCLAVIIPLLFWILLQRKREVPVTPEDIP